MQLPMLGLLPSHLQPLLQLLLLVHSCDTASAATQLRPNRHLLPPPPAHLICLRMPPTSSYTTLSVRLSSFSSSAAATAHIHILTAAAALSAHLICAIYLRTPPTSSYPTSSSFSTAADMWTQMHPLLLLLLLFCRLT